MKGLENKYYKRRKIVTEAIETQKEMYTNNSYDLNMAVP